ncbi:MAG: hypothetical protein DRI01_05905 [Chloroflexi bacterium]|nr:MAG: hypothetical protein DRI01_05905 [Chloroflexota bacterium]
MVEQNYRIRIKFGEVEIEADGDKYFVEKHIEEFKTEMPKIASELPSKEDLRIQYQQCIEHYRMLDRHIWQVPSVTIAIVSAIVGVAFVYLKDALIPSGILLAFGMILSFTMYIVVKKGRFFQYYIVERMRKIEDELSLEHLPLITDKNGTDPRNWIEGQHAGDWLARTVLFMFIGLAVLLIFNICTGL